MAVKQQRDPAGGHDRGPLVVWAIFAAFLAVEASLACWWPIGLASARPGTRDFVAPDDLSAAATVGQLFRTGATGLSAVAVSPRSAGPVTGGSITVELREAIGPNARTCNAQGAILRRASVPASAFVSRPEHVWTFEPVDISRGRLFCLEITTVPGVGLLAMRSRTDADGQLFVGGRPVWAQLAFRTAATHDTIAKQILHRLRSRSLSIVDAATLVEAAIAGHAALLGVLYLTLAGVRRAATPARPSGASAEPRQPGN